MSFKSRVLFFIKNDNTIYQLLLLGLLIAAPIHHYLFFDNSFDPLSLRIGGSLLCLIALLLSFYPAKFIYKLSICTVVVYMLAVNNCFLLSKNNFDHIYLFSTVRVFIALTLFCKKPWQFITLYLLNLSAILIAYTTAPQVHITLVGLVVLLLRLRL